MLPQFVRLASVKQFDRTRLRNAIPRRELFGEQGRPTTCVVQAPIHALHRKSALCDEWHCSGDLQIAVTTKMSESEFDTSASAATTPLPLPRQSSTPPGNNAEISFPDHSLHCLR